jgi:hypothetical protein
MAVVQKTGLGFIKTLAACILAPLSCEVSSVSVRFIIFTTNRLLTDIRPEIIAIYAAIAGSCAGIFGARWLCDRWLHGYLHQAIFFLFLALISVFMYFYVFVIPFTWTALPEYAQVCIVLILDYLLFWKVVALE